jgi:tetratricopeptide (TPR) repeat protein
MSAGWLKKFTPHKTRLDIIANIYNDIGNLMGRTNNIDQQINRYKQAGLLAGEVKDYSLLALVNASIGKAYLSLNRLDSALIFEQNAELIFKRTGLKTYAGFGYEIMGNIYLKKGNHDLAFQYFHKAINVNVELKNNYKEFYRCYAVLTDYYLSEKQKDSSLYYATKALATLKSMGSKDLDEAYENLYKSYQLNGITDSAYKYQGLALTAKDSSFNATTKSLADFQKLSFQEQIRAQELEKEKDSKSKKLTIYCLSKKRR